tara:strand:- start:1355 stop:1465 length:111 start_codon:yes stop_codon:yes gene_type:complete
MKKTIKIEGKEENMIEFLAVLTQVSEDFKLVITIVD